MDGDLRHHNQKHNRFGYSLPYILCHLRLNSPRVPSFFLSPLLLISSSSLWPHTHSIDINSGPHADSSSFKLQEQLANDIGKVDMLFPRSVEEGINFQVGARIVKI
ncbi:hypothetical protein R6Q59_013830, partial [Mikania micrantha]